MTILMALKSGKNFKRKGAWGAWFFFDKKTGNIFSTSFKAKKSRVWTNATYLSAKDILATDWEIKQ